MKKMRSSNNIDSFFSRAGWLIPQLNFQAKLIVACGGLGALVLIFSIIAGSWFYSIDKKSYVFELQAAKSSDAASRILVSILDSKASFEFSEVKADELPMMDGIPRPPGGDELFIARKLNETRETYILGRTKDGLLWKRKLKLPKWNKSDGRMFLMTSDGKFISSSKSQWPDPDNLLKMESVRYALESKLSEAFVAVKEGKQQLVVGYKEIPGTNVILISEISLANVLLPLRNALGIWFMCGLIVMFTGAIVSTVLVSTLVKPIREIIRMLVHISKGDFSVKSSYNKHDEFKEIFVGIDFLSKEVLKRENNLRNISKNLTHILQMSVELSEKVLLEEYLLCCMETLFSILEPYNSKEAYLRVPKNVLDIFEKPTSNMSDICFRSKYPRELLEQQKHTSQEDGVLVLQSCLPGSLSFLEFAFDSIKKESVATGTYEVLKIFSETVSRSIEHKQAEKVRNIQASIDQEMKFAKGIQEALLTEMEDIVGTRISSHYSAANNVGGDWMGVFHHPEAQVLHFFLGDVSGHGVSSALVTGAVSGAIRFSENAYCSEDSGTYLLNLTQRLDELVTQVGRQKLFMTMILGSLNLVTGKVHLINKGHPVPLVMGTGISQDDEAQLLLSNDPLGSCSTDQIKAAEIYLKAHMGLCLYSDGLLDNHYPHTKLNRKILRKTLINQNDVHIAMQALLNLAKGDNWRDPELRKFEITPVDDEAVLMLQWLGGAMVQREMDSTI